MAWSTPTTPVSGTVITVAWAVSSVVDPTNWLRTLTGGADPPASNRVVVSLSTTSTSWQQVPTDAIADAAVTEAKIANLPVRAVNPLIALMANATPSGFFDAGSATDSPAAGGDWHVIQSQNRIGSSYRLQLACNIVDQNQFYIREIIASVGQAWRKIWHEGNDGVGSGLDADLLDGQSGAFYATATALAAVHEVPAGAVVWFRTAAEVTAAGASWATETNLAGRMPIGAGTTFSQTFVEANNYGANWTPLTGATIAASGEAPFLASPTGGTTNVNTSSHGHVVPTTTWIPPMRAGVWARRI